MVLSNFKKHLRRYLGFVKKGARILMDRDQAVAEITPVFRDSSKGSHLLDQLEQGGLLRRGDAKSLKGWSSSFKKSGKGVLAALLEERVSKPS